MYNNFEIIGEYFKISDFIILIIILSIMIIPIIIYFTYKMKIEIKAKYEIAVEKRIQELKEKEK